MQRGELVYALNIPSTNKIIKDWKLNNLYDQLFFAKEGFDFKLQFVGMPENTFGFKFETKKDGSNLWIDSPTQLTGQLFNPKTKQTVDIKLVPFGSTILRQVTFPIKK